MRRAPGEWRTIISSAAFRSAVPVAWVNVAATISPLRFSISVWPMKLAKLGFLAPSLAIKLRLGIRGRGVRGVAALLAVKIALAIAARAGRIVRTVLRPETLHRGPGRNLRTVDREVLVRQQPAQLVMIHELGEELPRHVGLKQPIAVLREHRRHPYRLVHAEPDEPAIEKVIIELLHQLPFRPDRIERLQQKRPQQPLRRN